MVVQKIIVKRYCVSNLFIVIVYWVDLVLLLDFWFILCDIKFHKSCRTKQLKVPILSFIWFIVGSCSILLLFCSISNLSSVYQAGRLVSTAELITQDLEFLMQDFEFFMKDSWFFHEGCVVFHAGLVLSLQDVYHAGHGISQARLRASHARLGVSHEGRGVFHEELDVSHEGPVVCPARRVGSHAILVVSHAALESFACRTWSFS